MTNHVLTCDAFGVISSKLGEEDETDFVYALCTGTGR